MVVGQPIFFVRHPLTTWNANGIFMGQEDVEILSDSVIDLTALPASLKEVHIFYSPLKRGMQTLLLIMDKLIKELSCEKIITERIDDLKERSLGSFQKGNKDLIRRNFPGFFDSEVFIPSKTPPEGESFLCFNKRVAKFYSNFCSCNQHPIILVSHLQVYRMLVCIIHNYDPDKTWSKIYCPHGTLINLRQ